MDSVHKLLHRVLFQAIYNFFSGDIIQKSAGNKKGKSKKRDNSENSSDNENWLLMLFMSLRFYYVIHVTSILLFLNS